MALCVDTKLALIKQGCFVQMTKGPGLFPRSHNHPGVEWILIHSGGARISTEGWTTTALPGSIVVIPGKLEHSTCPISQPFSRTVIHAADELCVMENFTDADDQRHSVELSADAFDRCFWAARQLYALTTPQKQPLTKVLHKLVDLIYAEFESAQNNAIQPPKFRVFSRSCSFYLSFWFFRSKCYRLTDNASAANCFLKLKRR